MATSKPPKSDPPRRELGRAGRYDLLLEVASGGMATVYLARAPLDVDPAAPTAVGGGQLVAVKRPHRHLANDRPFVAMLLDEARLASKIFHPNVVRVRELGFEEEEPFLVLDYIEGASLSDLRKQLAAAERAVDTRVAVRVVLDALAGLHAAHELADENGRPLGIIHRDVSPHNVLIRYDGRALLADFGVAKAEDRVQTTRTHEVKGKLAYLAPERVDRRRLCTKQSDVFSMGVVLWECLAGRRLFRGEEALETLQQVASMPIPRLRKLGADVSEGLDAAIARALSRDMSERFATAEDFAAAIRRGARPEEIGRAEDVARVVEAVFAPRLQQRHDELRLALGSQEAERALVATGLTPRARAPVDLDPGSAVLSAIAPPAPSERYVFDQGLPEVNAPPRRRAWPVAGGAIAALLVGVTSMIVLARGAREDAPATALAPAASPAPLVETASPLPVVAPHVEDEDVARADGGAPLVLAPDPRPVDPPSRAPTKRNPRRRTPAPLSTTADGFTKVR